MEKSLNRQEIEKLMPHQDPFLFLDEATLGIGSASAKYKIKGDEFFLKGHFKDNPVFPGTLMLEAVGQLGVLYLLASGDPALAKPVDPKNLLHLLRQRAVLAHLPPRGDARHLP